MPLPADSVEGLAGLYQYRDFAHFLQTWLVTTRVLQTSEDFRQVVVDYAAEAASHGAVYLEGIFTPAEPMLARRRPTPSSPGTATARSRPMSCTAFTSG